MNKKTIGIIVGSLRRDSFSKKVAQYVADLLEEQFVVTFVDISDLALFNQDMESDPPQEWLRLRQEVKAADAVLFVTPEYNRSMPAVLKNALDVGSRPYTDNAWNGKPAAAIGVSPGSIGAFGAVNHLHQSAACVGLLMMSQPEAYLGAIMAALGDTGVEGEKVQGILQRFVDAFAAWVNRLAS